MTSHLIPHTSYLKIMKRFLATLALVVASIIAIWAMLLPPQGEVSQSVLIEVAQFLLYSATLLGVDIAIDKIKELLRKKE